MDSRFEVHIKMIVILLVLFPASVHAQFAGTTITISFDNQPVEKVLDMISMKTGYHFSYSKEMIDVSSAKTGDYKDHPLKKVLDSLFGDPGVKFLLIDDVIVIKKKQQKKLVFQGVVQEKGTGLPVPYAGIQFKGLLVGTYADGQGRFFMEMEEIPPADSLLVSAISYKSLDLPFSSSQMNNNQVIKLEKSPLVLEPAIIEADKLEQQNMGNNKKFALSRLYIDTHGQQAALFIENETGQSPKITKLNYYLTRDGNTNAPFRVRLYAPAKDGSPGKDLLPGIIIAKPGNDPGWFTVDIYQYNVRIPENGIFVAIQGVYPNDYPGDEDQTVANEIMYGQQVACSRARDNNTWHYSLSRTWFQAEASKLELMVSLEALCSTKKRKKE